MPVTSISMTNPTVLVQQPPVEQERLNKTTKQVSIEFIALASPRTIKETL
jgi:tryptophan synthase alpha subunit